MTRTYAQSPAATRALRLVEALQTIFATTLERIDQSQGATDGFERVEWLRSAGANGGGVRLCTADSPAYGRASINVSQVHYDGLPNKKLASATAISSIVHPSNPFAPSIHLHISWTEYKSGEGYWRIMADLNPSILDDEGAERFEAALRTVAPDLHEQAREEGERYFFIPSLERHRGVVHFYLESYATSDADADAQLAEGIARAAIEAYGQLVSAALSKHATATEEDRSMQLAYHTVYLFQVLTLDRGTTAGLLVHDENDLGILGSLPPQVDPELFASWQAGVPAPQDELVSKLSAALGPDNPAPVNDSTKTRLAAVLREHYAKHPGALELQASASVRPPSVENHR